MSALRDKLGLIFTITFSFLQGLLISDRLGHQFGIRVLRAAIKLGGVKVHRTVGLIPVNMAGPKKLETQQS